MYKLNYIHLKYMRVLFIAYFLLKCKKKKKKKLIPGSDTDTRVWAQNNKSPV